MRIALIAALLLAAPAFAKGGDKHPNITAAHNACQQALKKIEAAQTANEFDMEGHAAKAKDLLTQAEAELKQAREAANANKAK
ncbi:MAG TPA: hypothetical protein VLW85_03515 [Myxococcales bacterium]|nr:hypothetical protein [Myxococcales bacterium]